MPRYGSAVRSQIIRLLTWISVRLMQRPGRCKFALLVERHARDKRPV